MYVKRILPNGVRLITERIDNMRTVSVGIWVGNGSRYEPAELGGVSHFIEHMIIQGHGKTLCPPYCNRNRCIRRAGECIHR